jgi:serine/threonine protein phosphatase PrpC
VFGAASHVGLVRSENQDMYGLFPSGFKGDLEPKGRLFVLADGMGGHNGGRFASELAVKTIGEVYFSARSQKVQESLVKAMQTANAAVHTASIQDPALVGMGTTCVALVVRGLSVYVAHIGDSRAYRIKGEGIHQITDDHSVAAELYRRGMISAEEAKNHRERSVLYRALGTGKEVEIDVQPEHVVRDEEWFVLCSDGLSNMVSDSEINRIVKAQPPEWACDELIALANERGGNDNITVVVVKVSVR